MRFFSLILLSAFMHLSLSSTASALIIRVAESVNEKPPVFMHNPLGKMPLPISLQVFNDSGTMESVALWQLSLSIIGAPDSTGSIQLVDFSSPAVPFFDTPISPLVITTPSTQVTFQAADIPTPPDFPGKNVAPGESHDLLAIELTSSDNATGKFKLIMEPFGLPLDGSFWLGLNPVPQTYSNILSPTSPGQIVLAEIVLIPESNTVTLICIGLITMAFLRFRSQHCLQT